MSVSSNRHCGTRARRAYWHTIAVNAGLIASSLLVGLVAGEVALRVAGIGYGNSPLEASRRLHHVHPRSYEFGMYDPAGEFGGYTVRYDANGYRVSDEAPPTAPSRRIAFLGDSFTEGNTVDWHETFIGKLEHANRDIVTRNFGVASYASLMYLIQAKQDLPSFRPTDVVLQLFSNDFDDDHAYLERASSQDVDKVEWIDGGSQSLSIGLLRHSYLARLIRRGQLTLAYTLSRQDKSDAPTYVGRFGRDLTFSIVVAVKREVERQGAHFYLMNIPDKLLAARGKCCADDALSKDVAAFAHRNDIAYVNLSSAFAAFPDQAALFYRRDIHLTSAGNRLVAETLAGAMGLRSP